MKLVILSQLEMLDCGALENRGDTGLAKVIKTYRQDNSY